MMELTVDLIYNRLSEHFPVDYKVSNNSGALIGRPVFFDDSCQPERNICLITPDDLIAQPLSRGVYISVGDSWAADFVDELDLLIVQEDIPVRVLFNKLQSIFDYYDDWEKKLKAVIEKDLGYQELIGTTCDHLDCTVTLVDADMNYVAYSKKHINDYEDLIQDNKISPSGLVELLSNPLFDKVVEETDIFEFELRGETFLCYNFRNDNHYIGRAVIYCEKEQLKETYRFIFRILIYHIELLLAKYGSFLNEKDNYSSLRAVLGDILDSKFIDREQLNNTLSLFNWNSFDEYSIIRLQPEFRHEWQLHASYLIPLIEKQWQGTCAIEHAGYVMIVLNKSVYKQVPGKNFSQELAYFLRDGLMMAGVSRSFKNFEHFPDYYRQTEIAVSMGRLLKPNRWCYYFDDFALKYWQRYGVANFLPEQICSRVLLGLLEHDKKNNTQFYETLVALCENKYNYSQTAKALFIHRTTFLYRLERIAEITGLDLDSNDERLYLELSYRYLEEGK